MPAWCPSSRWLARECHLCPGQHRRDCGPLFPPIPQPLPSQVALPSSFPHCVPTLSSLLSCAPSQGTLILSQ